jgi:hypothetical protein
MRHTLMLSIRLIYYLVSATASGRGARLGFAI